MKTLMASIAIAAALALDAAPSADNYAAVTNDWAQGNYSNVYEWAQQRLAANTNDLPGAYAMLEYDLCFSDFNAMSNSIQRMMRVSDDVTLPAFTNLYQSTRAGWVYYLDHFLPAQNDAERLVEQQKSLIPGRRMTCDIVLELLQDNDLW